MQQSPSGKTGKPVRRKRSGTETPGEQLDLAKVANLTPFLLNSLRICARSRQRSAAAALNHLFVSLYGENRTRHELHRFLLVAAPLARRVAIEFANPEDGIGADDITVADLQECLLSLDAIDPVVARIIDLHWFADLSIRNTADALDLHPQDVTRRLRAAKARWRAGRQDPTAPQLQRLHRRRD